MKYILGLDQGASKTHAVIIDELGNVKGFGTGGGANHAVNGIDFAMDQVEDAFTQAITEAGLTKDDIYEIGAGITGIDWDYETELVSNAIRDRLKIERIIAVNDCIIAMRGGTSGTVSAIICAGSGLNCAVRDGDRLYTYGYYIPPHCGGSGALGAAAIQAVLDSEAGLVGPTALTGALLDFFGLPTVDDLMRFRETGKIRFKEHIVKVVRILGDVAAAGDPVAMEIWKESARSMAGLIIRRAEIMGITDKAIEVVVSGGVFKTKYKGFDETVREEILKGIPRATVAEAIYEPVIGAALLAFDHLYNNHVPDSVYQNLNLSAEKYPVKRIG